MTTFRNFLDEHIVGAHLVEGLMTLGQLREMYRVALDAVAKIAPGTKLTAPKAKRIAEVMKWKQFKLQFQSALTLSDALAKEMTEHNLSIEIDATGDRGQYIVGHRRLKPSQALMELRSNGESAVHILTAGRYHALAVLETSGLEPFARKRRLIK